MKFINNIKVDFNAPWLLKFAIIFFINLFLISAAYAAFEYNYKDRIYPGARVGRVDLGGKTAEEAVKILNEKVDKIKNDGIVFSYNNKKTSVMPIIASENGDLAYEIIDFDTEGTINRITANGRNNNFFVNLKNQAEALILTKNFPFQAIINEDELYKILKNNFNKLETPAENAKLVYNSEKNTDGSGQQNVGFTIIKEKSGKAINYKNGLSLLKINLGQLENPTIKLYSENNFPEVYEADCLNIKPEAEQFLTQAPLILIYAAESLTDKASSSATSSANSLYTDKKIWKIEKDELAGWLDLKINPEYKTSGREKVTIALNKDAVNKYLAEKVASKIDKEPKDAKFKILNGKMAQFQTASDGIKIDIEASRGNIETGFLKNGRNEILLKADKIKSAVNAEEVNNLGIKEIIGTGTSNFSGSPKNRIHNISVGANAVNGALIKPGEEFSLIKTLGAIDGTSGYLQELVIKDNKTIPEYGGGLCQIGTTMFRAALASGLPITMRKNHSYRVGYYEPAGTDATIYDPFPDFRFINDTGNYLLIQTKMSGSNLYFDVWGTKDGRISERTKPVIFNIVKPKPTKIVETLDLKPGVKKCSETAHNGADAFFDYIVTYPNGEVKEKRFTSHYVPWQAVCLVGVEKLTVSSGENSTASSTTATIKTTTPIASSSPPITATTTQF